MAQSNFGWQPGMSVQGTMGQNMGQNNAKKSQSISSRSPAYTICANKFIYAFKKGTNFAQGKEGSWTPHNYKKLVITRQGAIIYTYAGNKMLDAKFTPADATSNPAFYTDMCDFLYSLDNGTNAKVKNIQDVVIFYGEDKGIPKAAAGALKESIKKAYAEKVYPNIVLVDDRLYGEAYQSKVLEGKKALIATQISKFGKDYVYLTQDDKQYWSVTDKKPINREGTIDEKGNLIDKSTHISFGINNQHSLFQNIISDGAALQEYLKTSPNSGIFVENTPQPMLLSRLWTDTGVYPADNKLRDYFSSNIYRPAAVWEFLSGITGSYTEGSTYQLDQDSLFRLVSLYDTCCQGCANSTQGSYRNRLLTPGAKKALRGEVMPRLLPSLESRDRVISLMDKFLNTTKSEDRQKLLDTEIGISDREPFTQLVINTVIYFATITEVCYLLRFGFRYSNQIAEFMIPAKLKSLEGTVAIHSKRLLLPMLKNIINADGASGAEHTDKDIETALDTAIRLLHGKESNALTQEDAYKHLELINILI